MEEIINRFKQSIEDELLSKEEKRSIKEIVSQLALNTSQLNFLRGKVYELAHEKATDANYRFIMEWVKQANSSLRTKPKEASDVFFSPGESCRAAITQQIEKAINQLSICVFTISDDRISNAIAMAHRKGVNVKIITDNDKSLDVGSDIERLAKEGIKIKMDNTSNHMHHKFMVADGRVALTGSYNWTQSAARFNHENIITTTQVGVVKSFLSEFDKLWQEMGDYK
jgi:mitochondrial cardiolipin hydrolase